MNTDKIVISVLFVLLFIGGIFIGQHTVKPEIIEVNKTLVVKEPVLKVERIPEVKVINNTVVKEIPKEIVKTVKEEVIINKLEDFKAEILDYLKNNFSDCEGFNRSNFADEEITLHDTDDIVFTVYFEDDSSEEPDFSDIFVKAEYKYKADGIPREYHKFNVLIGYDNEDREITSCNMTQLY